MADSVNVIFSYIFLRLQVKRGWTSCLFPLRLHLSGAIFLHARIETCVGRQSKLRVLVS